MKPLIRILIQVLAGGGLGFAAALTFVRFLIPAPTASSAYPAAGIISSQAAFSSFGGLAAAFLPPAGALEKMGAGDRLACFLQMRGLSPEQRRVFLQDCLGRPEPERTSLLAVLLSEWSETAPMAAAEWALSHLEKEEAARTCIGDITRNWAARDGQGLAEWVNALVLKKDRKLAEDFKAMAMSALERHDPFWHASLCEMACNSGWTWTGMDFTLSLRTPEAVKAMSARLEGHVAYIEDTAEIQRQISRRAYNWHPKHKTGWNTLFEQTAVAWHRMNAAECDTWLRSWPENAQLVARHFIKESKSGSE